MELAAALCFNGPVRVVQIQEFGGPEVLRTVEVPDPPSRQGELLVEVTYAGINYRDTHLSEVGSLPGDALPLIPGMELVGTTGGRRIAAVVARGGYAQRAAVPASMATDIPDGVDDFSALGLVVQGTTAWLLLHEIARMRAGETVVVHAAAGGVGSLAVQLAKSAGAGRVIALASTAAKRALAADLGADETVDSTREDLDSAVREANGGVGVDLVLDMAGGDVTEQSRAMLAPLGKLVCYGMASRRTPPAIPVASLLESSTSVSGFVLEHATTRPGLIDHAMGELFGEVAAGRLRVVCGGVYGLSQVRAAHEDLAGRRTVGKLALDPNREVSCTA